MLYVPNSALFWYAYLKYCQFISWLSDKHCRPVKTNPLQPHSHFLILVHCSSNSRTNGRRHISTSIKLPRRVPCPYSGACVCHLIIPPSCRCNVHTASTQHVLSIVKKE